MVFALGIRYVGAQVAELLANAFRDLDALSVATVDELEAVDGIGRKTAESVIAWMTREKNRDFLSRLKAAGVRWRERSVPASTGPLAGEDLPAHRQPGHDVARPCRVAAARVGSEDRPWHEQGRGLPGGRRQPWIEAR